MLGHLDLNLLFTKIGYSRLLAMFLINKMIMTAICFMREGNLILLRRDRWNLI